MPRLEHRFPDDRVFLPEEAHSYGRPNRPSTPVGDVISNYYGDIANKQITQKYDILKETSKPLGLSYARGHTKASAMAHNHISQTNFNKSYAGVNERNLFKMSKFSNVNPRTNTHNGKKSLYK
jgi:hypothetical protein